VSYFIQRPSLIIAFLAASISGVVILLHWMGWVTVNYSIRILAPLATVIFVALVAASGKAREEVFLTRLWGGVLAGVAGLLAYDLGRLLIVLVGQVPFNPFRVIEVFGLLILDTTVDTELTKAVGWAFHTWNSIAFAVMYTLAVGPGRVLWGLAWGLMLEVIMIATYPSLFGVQMGWGFFLVSISGHVFYGLALGATARKVVRY
jgi:hypothetical protein